MDIKREETTTAWPGHRWQDMWVLAPGATCTRKISWPSLMRRNKGGARTRGAAVHRIHCTDTKSNSRNTRTYVNPLRCTRTSAPMDRWVSWVLMPSAQHLRVAPSSIIKEGTCAIPSQSSSTTAPDWGFSSRWQCAQKTAMRGGSVCMVEGTWDCRGSRDTDRWAKESARKQQGTLGAPIREK